MFSRTLCQSILSIVILIVGLVTHAGHLETDITRAKQGWQERVQKIREGRKGQTSYIYYDSAKSLGSSNTVYLTRYLSGKSDNKVSTHLQRPSSLTEGETLLGVVRATDSTQGEFIFEPTNGQIVPIKMGEIQILESLNVGVWIYGGEGERAIAVYNYSRPYADRFVDIKFFDYNPEWRVRVFFESSREEVVVPRSDDSEGANVRLGFLRFMYRGRVHKVAVYEYNEFSDEDGKVQIRFRDMSKESYGGGRYLYAANRDVKNSDGFILDFNQAFDPPCAWSQAYTCSLPRLDETLDVEVNAGAKYPLSDIY